MNVSDEASDCGRQSGIQVIARSAAIMRALGENPQGLSLAAIAQRVGLPRSTVQRIINALQEELLVEPMGPAGGFRLGPALGHLINKTQCDIISHTRPLLVELSDQLGETVCLCRRSYDQVQIIERIVAERELRVVVPIGAHGPAVQTASGQVLLALEAPECVEALVGDMNVEWRARLGAIRAQGWASGFDEVVPGISSCAMAVDTYLGMFAIAVVAPTVRARDHQDAFRAALQACKRGIERAIGRQG
ncbi:MULTISPECIES: IclR family transcriptional regulator [Pseudomonas]|uniref:Transcriptional regulator, IclR family n=1 Tax=Pseudomonas flexibilis TaxID=706570 RepID=A0A0B3C3N4_9PSED|nr:MULTISPECIES: IclR family transcriptional regulator [Pseudomonas]KHO66112.1 hypothetical protein PT85_00545 [Pseudomonas flexibilis]SCY51134.1 transcriptional regulator, IclR family [Pseudomonas flexibilis]